MQKKKILVLGMALGIISVSLQTASAVDPAPSAADCASVVDLQLQCGNIGCDRAKDGCVKIKLSTLGVTGQSSTSAYTPGGTYAFINIFSMAATRGVENATIRAMNSTKICADSKNCNFPAGWTTKKIGTVDAVVAPDGITFNLLTGQQVNSNGDPAPTLTQRLEWRNGKIYRIRVVDGKDVEELLN